MTSRHDAFGRATADAGDPRSDGVRPAPAPAVPGAGHPAGAGAATDPRGGPGARRARGGGLLLVLVLAAGVAGIWATLRRAVRAAEASPGAVTFALAKDPLGPRSLLRAAPLERALRRATAELRPGEGFTALTVTPVRATLTAVDPREQERWIVPLAAGGVQTSVLGTTSASRRIRLDRLDLTVPARAVRTRMRTLAPYAQDPSFSLVTDTGSGRAVGWVVSVRGVRSADAHAQIDLRGRRP